MSASDQSIADAGGSGDGDLATSESQDRSTRRQALGEMEAARYLQIIRPRYRTSGRKEKSRILEQAVEDTGLHRKSIIRALNRVNALPRPRSGRPVVYGTDMAEALFDLWHMLRQPDDRRLAAGAADAAAALVRNGRRCFPSELIQQLANVSPSTVRRLLLPLRRNAARRRPSPYARRINNAIRDGTPVRTSRDWADVRLGSMQADTVHHCGKTTAGVYICTLVVVDVRTSWIEFEALPRLQQGPLVSALDRIWRRLPFPLHSLHSDSGSEFMNFSLAGWCERRGVERTRGRPRRSNDQAVVEQRNNTFVRVPVGHGRYEGAAAHAALAELYVPLRDLANFFLPVEKTVGGPTATIPLRGEHVTPYRRLLEEDALDERARRQLATYCEPLDPESLSERIDAALDRLEQLEA